MGLIEAASILGLIEAVSIRISSLKHKCINKDSGNSTFLVVMQRVGPEKIGDRPSQTDGPPLPVKNDSSLKCLPYNLNGKMLYSKTSGHHVIS